MPQLQYAALLDRPPSPMHPVASRLLTASPFQGQGMPLAAAAWDAFQSSPLSYSLAPSDENKSGMEGTYSLATEHVRTPPHLLLAGSQHFGEQAKEEGEEEGDGAFSLYDPQPDTHQPRTGQYFPFLGFGDMPSPFSQDALLWTPQAGGGGLPGLGDRASPFALAAATAAVNPEELLCRGPYAEVVDTLACMSSSPVHALWNPDPRTSLQHLATTDARWLSAGLDEGYHSAPQRRSPPTSSPKPAAKKRPASEHHHKGRIPQAPAGATLTDLVHAPPILTADGHFRCPWCPKAFQRKHDLNRHRVSHRADEEHKHACGACELKFTRRDALLRHVRGGKCKGGGRPDYSLAGRG
jgi:hypothetical protein